jgi:hypothetical protein
MADEKPKPKPKHIPPHIKREDFSIGVLKPQSYCGADVSAAIVDHLSRRKDELTPTQIRGLNNFKYHGYHGASLNPKI